MTDTDAGTRPLAVPSTGTAPQTAQTAGRARTLTSILFCVLALPGAGLTFALPEVLNGTAVMNGSARGTGLVIVLAGLPALLAATWLAARHSHRAAAVHLGVAFYLVYNCVLLLFATPFNALFPLYLPMLTLALGTTWAAVASLDAGRVTAGFRHGAGARAVAAYLGLVVAGNTALWISGFAPDLDDAARPRFLAGTGLPTNPIFVQDLAVWLPLGALAVVWFWRARPWGVVLAVAYLAMWVLESISVAVDQWFGGLADPESTVASTTMVLPFAVLALLNLVLLLAVLSRFRPWHRRAGTTS